MAELKSQDIYSTFVKAFACGEILPGERLGEASLAARWGVSRLPVHNALLRLEGEGFVERIDKSGTYVKQFDIAELEELYGLRGAIESFVLRKVTQVVTDQQLDELEKLARDIDTIEAGADIETVIEVESRFHLRLCEIANLPHARRILSHQQLLVRCFAMSLQFTQGIEEESRPYHLELVAALRTRNAASAAKIYEQETKGNLRYLRKLAKQKKKAAK